MARSIRVKSILTERGIEYLSLVALGNKNKEIAVILSVSNSTVKKSLESIFLKLNAKDRAHAVTIGFVHNILTPYQLSEISLKYNLEKFHQLENVKCTSKVNS